MTTRTFLRWLWVAVAAQLVGRLLDLRWHLTHDEFEGTAQQFEAHWLLWIGVLGTFAVGLVGLRARPQGIPRAGTRLLLLATVGYIGVAVWHFVEHANGADPELAHILLAIAQVAMITAVIAITIAARRDHRPPQAAQPA